ncbi:sensor histidine kinase [Paenibacillus ginsengarvi]|uniref:histidine kinase n=1 Tax=Paenibacillus ginsengarvi TaxID=400777 RepID=A0A3B0BIA7_9BACL|nr:ATP-binding protein [Paenibacillus ginsengarvi]RKN72384.1 sensor histidine kinase [Paenibacillus ginsengarvi]
MSLRTRLMVLTSAWLVFILVLFSTLLYSFFVGITAKSEKELLFGKAQSILENRKVHDERYWSDADLLDEFLVSDEMIRIIGMDGLVKLELQSNEILVVEPPHVTTRDSFSIKRIDKTRYLYVEVPIMSGSEQIGVLEIARKLTKWSLYINVLTTALILMSIGAVVVSAIGSFFYSSFLFQPLRQLNSTMQMIQLSGTFRKLDDEFMARTDELGKLGITFNEMISRLEELVQKQKRFVADASHELRTPLTIIESYAGMLNRWGSEDPELRKEAIDAILGESHRLKSLVGSLMQLAESEQEDWLRMEQIDLMAIVRSAASAMEVAFSRDIRIESRSDSVPITGDSEKLKQLLIILLDNAIKYSAEPVRIRVVALQQAVQVMVVDEGIGMEDKTLPFLFDRFFRTDLARTRQTGGFGLGLSIAKSIVERHEGAIRIESRPGKGTTVIVELPR